MSKVDAAGRRWYTSQFKNEIVTRCLQPGASVAGIAVESGLNPNLVRKWIERAHKAGRKLVPLLPVVLADAQAPVRAELPSTCIEIRVGDAVIAVGERASARQIEAIVRALR